MLSRMKFEIEPLVAGMLDQLPRTVWTSDSTTFFDPAIGGGQFVRAIEQRLRAHGHSDTNIRNRVFGFEESDLHIRFAVNKYKLVGQYVRKPYEKLFELDNTMKFDVVVGNPPYQSGNGESGGKHSLWRKFVKKSFELCANNGYVSLVCPGFPYQANDVGRCFTENTPLVLNNDASGYFPGIGSEIKYWIVKQGNHNLPFIVDGQVWANRLIDDPTIPPIVTAINKKINLFPKFECKQDRGYSSTQLKNDNTDYFTKPTADSIYPIRHGSINKVCYVKAPTECHTKRKVMMIFSGYPSFEYYDETTPMSSCYQMSGYIEVNDRTEGDALIKLYTSKLYTWISNPFNKGTFKGITNYSLPKISLTRNWTDNDLYKHFNLTQEEIDYIENAVK